VSVKSDRWILKMCLENGMIRPFEARLVREVEGRRIISAGVSSYGYDLRLAPDGFRVFSPIASAEIDPKNFDENSLVEAPLRIAEDGSQYWLLPPHSYALGVTVETFDIPRNVVGLCMGKCLPGDVRVIDASTGEMVELRTFVEERRKQIGTLNGHRITASPVTSHIYSGVKPTYEVTTGSGRVIRATGHHPFLTFEGWLELLHLRVGDRIGVPREIPIFGNEDLPDHEADILGLLISDGQCGTPGYSPGYTSGDERLRLYFAEAVRKFGCLTSSRTDISLRVVNRHGRGGLMTGHPNRMNVWLEKMGLAVKSVENFVPECVFRATRQSIARFLRALFSGDGSVYMSGRSAVLVEYCSTSERLIRDVQHLLLRFGIIARLRLKTTNYGTSAFVLNISDKDAIRKFGEEIGFIPDSHKDRRLQETLDYIGRFPKRKSNFDTIPTTGWAMLKQVCYKHGHSMRSLGVDPNWRQSVPRREFVKLGEMLDETDLIEIGQSHVLWDTVESIKLIGEEPVYDLSVPATNNFIANDFIVHNSTYARSGLIVNTTPLEPGWRGRLVLEFSNSADLPIRIYANEGIAQVTFFESDEDCETSYADRAGKYQDQVGLVTPRL